MPRNTYKSFEYNRLNKVLHNRLRLAIMAALAHSDEVDFVSLKNAVNATDGNLSIQLKKLSNEGYIAINKIIHKNRPQTNVALTNEGRNALKRYRNMLMDWFDYQN